MFNLPDSTIVNKEISKEKFMRYSQDNEALSDVFANQINSIIWRNKIGSGTMNISSGIRFPELQVIEVELKENAIDKRALSIIDKTIPYYVLYVQSHSNMYQAWMGDKRYTKRQSLNVNTYCRTQWISENIFPFSENAKSVDQIYTECKQCIEKYKFDRFNKVIIPSTEALAEYFETTPMSYSYKPVLMLALLQYGGTISVSQIVSYFTAYYTKRKLMSLTVEKGNCIFASSLNSYATMERNVITNPIKALMGSGFFEYDEGNKFFSLLHTLYDNMTIIDIDLIEKICRKRLKCYFDKI